MKICFDGKDGISLFCPLHESADGITLSRLHILDISFVSAELTHGQEGWFAGPRGCLLGQNLKPDISEPPTKADWLLKHK